MADAREMVDVLLALIGDESRSALVVLDGHDDVSCADIARELRRRQKRSLKPRIRRG